jgi:hypothetical protein
VRTVGCFTDGHGRAALAGVFQLDAVYAENVIRPGGRRYSVSAETA